MEPNPEVAAALAADRSKGLSVKKLLGRHPGVSATEYLKLLQELSPQAAELKRLVDGGMTVESAILQVEGLEEAHIREYLAASSNSQIPEAAVPRRGRRGRQSTPTPRSQGVHHGAAAAPDGHDEIEDPGGAAIRKRLAAGEPTAQRRRRRR